MNSKSNLPEKTMISLITNKSFQQKVNKFSVIGLVVCSTLATSLVIPKASYANSIFNNNDDVAQTKQNSKYRVNYQDFLNALGQMESGNNYEIRQPQINALGKYQFIEGLLMDLGYYTTSRPYIGGGNGVDKNYWRGTWTNKSIKYGVRSDQDFLRNRQVQELAIREAMQYKWGLITKELNRRGYSIKQFIGQRRGGVVVTKSGILAAAHLRGEKGVVALLVDNNISQSDEIGTNILVYLKKFAGYQVPFN